MEPSWARSPQAQTKSCLDIGIVGRIALFRALQDRQQALDMDDRSCLYGMVAIRRTASRRSRDAAMQAFARFYWKNTRDST